MRELGIAEHTRFDEAALDALSERASAQSVLYGQFLASGNDLRLDLTLRKAGAGVPIPLQVEAPTSDVFTIVDEITGRVKGELDLTPDQLRGDTDRPIAEVSSASLDALRAYQSGLADLNQGENQAAIEKLQEATRLDPNFAMAYAKLADAFMNAGEYLEAEAAIDRAKNLSDRFPLPLAERYQIHATAAAVKDDLETATKSYQELAKLYPADPDILLNLAGLYEGSGMLPEAIDAYGRVVELAPDYGEAHFGLAWVQLMSGNSEVAIRSLQDIVAKGQFRDEPEAMGMAHSILGVAYRETAEPEKALENFRLSLDYREQAGDLGGQATTLFNMAQVYVNLDQAGKGLDALGKALAIAREMGDREGESDFLLEIGRAHESEEDLDKAIAAYRESLQIEMERQDHTNLANRLDHIANIYRLKGQYDDALVYLEQAKTHLEQSEEKREQAINLNYIGLVRKAQGLYDEALEAFLAALPLFQEINYVMGVVETQRNSAEIYRSQGRYADAYASLQQQHQLVHDEIPTEHEIADAKAPLGRLLVVVGRLEEAEKQLHDAEHATSGGHTGISGPEILLGQAQLANLRGQQDIAAEVFKEANIQANLSGRKEIAVESRIELGRLYLAQAKLPNAERLLSRTRREAAQARLRPLEAEAAAALADVYLAKGDAEAAREAALESISLADRFSGRPVLYHAYACLGRAYRSLGRIEESLDAYAEAASTLEWIRGGLLTEHVDSFMVRPDVQEFLIETVPVLEEGGRTAEVAPLKKWLASPPSGS
jgi:tetratricopeptide (TPR) repeat protein